MHTLSADHGPDYAITITQFLEPERSGFKSHLYHSPEVWLLEMTSSLWCDSVFLQVTLMAPASEVIERNKWINSNDSATLWGLHTGYLILSLPLSSPRQPRPILCFTHGVREWIRWMSCSSVVEPGPGLTKTQHFQRKKWGKIHFLLLNSSQLCRFADLGDGPRIMGLGPWSINLYWYVFEHHQKRWRSLK